MTLAYSGLSLALLILASSWFRPLYRLATAAYVLSFISTLFLSILSFLEHSKKFRPSILLSLYLALSILFDAAHARTLLLLDGTSDFARLFIAAIAVKGTLLLVENYPKQRWIFASNACRSPEERTGIFSISVFSWLHPLLLMGYRKMLTVDDLFPLHMPLTADVL